LRARILGVVFLALLDEILAVLILLFWLPHFGVEIPLFYVVVILLGLAALSYMIYVLVKPVVVRPPVIGAEAMIGLKGEALTKLNPAGLVMVGGEIWRAQALESPIERRERVMVMAVEGLTLKVKKAQPDSGTL